MHGNLCFLQGFPQLLLFLHMEKNVIFGKKEILCINYIPVDKKGREGILPLSALWKYQIPFPPQVYAAVLGGVYEVHV